MLFSYEDKIALLKERIIDLNNEKEQLIEEIQLLQDENKDLKEILKENGIDFW